MPAIIEDLNIKLPQDISIDTSFLLRCAATIEPEILGYPFDPTPYCACIKNLINNNVLCYVSDFVIEEIYFKILQFHGTIIYEYYCTDKTRYKNWKHFCQNDSSRLGPAYSDIDKFNEFLDENLIFITPYVKDNGECIDNICEKATELIRTFNLITNDAFIIAHSLHYGVNNFLAIDNQWKSIDNIVYYRM